MSQGSIRNFVLLFLVAFSFLAYFISEIYWKKKKQKKRKCDKRNGTILTACSKSSDIPIDSSTLSRSTFNAVHTSSRHFIKHVKSGFGPTQ